MTWNKDPDKAFPAPHPREPGGLRQDILDEIADHLACAAEREEERQEEENEGAVWDRVLDRFGDPDAIARKLWWDQMRETVMREWIQTGVMVVVTIAVLAGLAMMTRLVTGVGTANDAMREAMKQVAASNEALAKAMAEQRAGNEAMLKTLSGIQGGGGEKADALELSNIEIVVRRGTPEGPPAPEVTVQMRGPGPNDGSLTVDGELDAEGRAAFERLYQGAYTLSFEDPTSGLFSERRITIFAGKGAGEHVIVAPDVTPRPVHIDWGLPEYGRDEELLLETTLVGTWAYEDQDWWAIVRVESGHAGTGTLGEPAQHSIVQRTRRERPGGIVVRDPRLMGCMVAGEVSVMDYLTLFGRSGPDAGWSHVAGVALKTTHAPAAARGTQAVRTGALEVVLTPISDGQYAAELPEDLLKEYGYLARLNRNRERVPSEDHETWREAVSKELTDSYIVQMEVLPTVRRGEWREGTVFAATDEIDPEALPVQRIAALALPDDWRSDLESGHQGLLGVRMDDERGFHAVEPDDVLEAYVIRSEWGSQTWTYWTPLVQQNIGAAMELDPSPFWSISGEAIRARAETTDDFYVPVPAELGSEGSAPMTGILLRWKWPSDTFAWPARIEEANKTNHSPRWIVTEPISTSVEGKILTDIDDDRFHSDAEVGEAIVSDPSAE